MSRRWNPVRTRRPSHCRPVLLVATLISAGLLVTGLEIRPAAAAPAAAAPAAAASAADGLTHLSLIPNGSEARYRVGLRMMGQPPSESICSTRAVTGEIVLGPDGAVVAEASRIVVDQRSLRCNAPLRDSNAQSMLETDRYPTAEFVVREAPGLPFPLPSEGQASFTLVGDQTQHGVTNPGTYQVTATFGAGEVAGLGTTQVRMTDFGMTPPRIGPLMSVDDRQTVELDFRAAVGGT